MATSIPPQDFFEKVKARERLHIVDIRRKDDFSSWNLYRSINIPFDKLINQVSQLSKNQEVIIISDYQNKGRKAVKILRSKGFAAWFLKEGLKGWNSISDIIKVNPINLTDLTIYQVKRLGKGCLSYIIFYKDKKKALIVDPSRYIMTYFNFIDKIGARLTAVIDTHIHSDHVSGAIKISRRKKVPYLLPESAKVKFKFTPLQITLPKMLENTKIDILQTPGHTPDCVSIVLDKAFCLTGDTLFLDSVGRPDVGQDFDISAKQLYSSIKQKISLQNDDTFILPSHTQQPMTPGPVIAATLRYVKRVNPMVKIRSEDKFLKQISKKTSTPMPKHYETIKEINTRGRKIRGVDIDKIELGDNKCAV